MGRSVSILGTRGYPSYYGGFETLVRRLAPYLADAGWEVTVYGRPGAAGSNESERDARIAVRNTKGFETKSLSTLSYGLTSTVASAWKKHDVALVMNVANGYWLPILKSRGIPTVLNVDGIEWERAKWGRLAREVFYRGARMSARFADHLICDSPVIQQRWEREFERTGVYIPYGGDAVEELPVYPGLKRGRYALVVARFVPENTIPEFLDAVEQIAKSHDVVIVGSSGYGGTLDERVEHLARNCPRVTWTGHISDDSKLFGLWQHAGAYFHGHSVGGTNPALVQAMACGAPIVARETPYNRQVLGEFGTFTEPVPSSIAKSVVAVLEDDELRARLSANAKRRAQEHFTWEQVCAAYENSLHQAMDLQKGR